MKTNDKDEDNILYELLIHTEWALDPEIVGGDSLSQGGSIFYRALMQTPSNLWSLVSNIGNSLWKWSSVTPNLARILNCGSEWQLGVGAQGAVIAVLQDSSLEVRAKKDEYASVVGKNYNLHVDPFPKWRRVSWSSECSMVAVAYSNGAVEIFNTVGASLFTIYPPRFQEGKIQVDASTALAALIFSDVRTEKIKWASELIMIDFYGNVRGYFVSPTEGYQESNTFSFRRLYPWGISAAVEIGSLLIVAGSCQYVNDSSLRNNGLGHGLSIWRMLNDYPFYKQVPTIDEDEYTLPRSSFLRHLPGFEPTPPYDCIFRLCVSPLGHQLAALHVSGSISVWDVPSLRKRKFWSLESQPRFDAQNYEGTFAAKRRRSQREGQSGAARLRNHLVDVKWWSEKAVTLARFSGAVTVCSVNSLTNLLGESPEFFEGVPQISETHDRCFLGLEMERSLVRAHSRSLLGASSPPSLDTSSGRDLMTSQGDMDEGGAGVEEAEWFPSTDEEEMSLIQKGKLLTLNILFWITDAERFRPWPLYSPVLSRRCRLLRLKSTTPLELFSRKIDNEEYGEALALAHRYDLDCDLVYQHQWRRSPLSVASIQDYLTKIRRRSWVLAECLAKVPDDIDAARELVLYGLRGTELDTLVGIAEGTNEDEFEVSDLSLEYEENPDLDEDEADAEAEAWAAKDLSKRRDLLSKINFHALSKEQIEVVRARQQLLQYYDRLSAYEVLLGGPHVAHERYDPSFYAKFREQSAVEAAVRLARGGNWRGVDAMFTYHGEHTLPHRLAIIANFPPTMGPYEYRSLLPECDLSGEVFEWEEDLLRDPDWCEDSLCRKAVGVSPDVGVTLAYEGGNEYLTAFRDADLTSESVMDWYQMRARDMESTSHFVDAALDLLKLGRERNVPGLEELQNTFDTLEVLVYEVGLHDLTLNKFESLSDLDKLKLLMSTSTSETHIQNLRRWGQAFLRHCDKRKAGLSKDLLREYVVSTAHQDLSIALKTIQHSQQDITDPILSCPEEVLRVALESIYICDKETQLPRAFAILECLPVRQPQSDSADLVALHQLVDALEDDLGAGEVLSSNGVLVAPSFVRSIRGDKDKVTRLLTRLARTAVRREGNFGNDDWNKLLTDMLEMQQKVFSVVEPRVCFEILTESLLTSGVREYMAFAHDFLMETRTEAGGSPVRNPYLQRLPYRTAVRLVLNAATEYFNSAESGADPDMGLAKHCLNMIESENERVAAELDLIAALDILPSIGIHKLPLQVRVCEDRLSLIEEALSHRPETYEEGTKLLRLASLLRVCGGDEGRRRGKVLTLIAEAAFKAGDMDAANSWCSQVVKGCHGEGWEVCARVGKCRDAGDLALRATFLDFALTHASADCLEDLLAARNEVELRLLYGRVSERIQSNVSLDSDDGFEDARSESGEESCKEEEEEEEEDDDKWEDPIPEAAPSLSSNRLLLSVTRNVLSATAASTSSFVSSVANKRMWKNAIGWLRPLRTFSTRGTKAAEGPDQEGNSGFAKQGSHAAYVDLCPEAYVSKLGPSYKSYAPPSMGSNPALDLSFTLLRIALIEESLCQGNSVQTNVTVLQEVVKGVLQEDVLLGVSFLVLLTSPKDVKNVFSSLPRTEISLQVCLYYYALQIYTSLHPWTQSGIAPVYLHSPDDVINCVRSVVGAVTPGSDVTDVTDEEDDDVTTYMKYFQNTDRLVSDYVQGQALQRLDAGVDIERFLADSEYKKDTVLGLAMSSDSEVMDLSVTLANKYGVPLAEVYLTHLQHLFDLAELSAAELRTIIRDRNVVSYLRERPAEFAVDMETKVLCLISGVDHDRLALYFSLLEDACADEGQKERARTHIQLLNQIKDVASGLDYKALLTPNSDTLEILKPVLTETNVDILAQVAQSIPRKEEFALDPSVVYCAWAQKHFFDTTDKVKLRTANDWNKRFDETKKMLTKMRAEDVNLLIRSFVFSEEAIARVPLETRRDMMRKAAKYCKTKSQEQMKDEGESNSWVDACARLTKLEKHLELLRSQTFKALSDSPDPKLKDYAHQFMLSGGEEKALERLAHRILLDLSSLDVLRSVLAVFPEDAMQVPEDIFLDVFKRTLGSLSARREKPCSAQDEETTPFRVLSHLLSELKEYCDDGGDLLDEEEVLDEVRRFARDELEEGNTLEDRVKVLAIAEEFLPLTEEDKRLLQSMKTGGIVRDAFSSPSKDKKGSSKAEEPTQTVDTEQGRRELLAKLVDKMDSIKKAKSIVELLNIWPKFDAQVYSDLDSNPWLRMFLKLLGNPKLKNETKDYLDLIYTSTKFCLQQEQMPKECVSELVEKLLESSSGERLKCAFKVALKAGHSHAQENIIEKYKNISQIDDSYYDDEVLRLIIEGKKVPRVLPTFLYGPLVSYLSEVENGELRRSVVDELESSNHWIEAASLAVYSSSIPRALKTASAAVETFRKWL